MYKSIIKRCIHNNPPNVWHKRLTNLMNENNNFKTENLLLKNENKNLINQLKKHTINKSNSWQELFQDMSLYMCTGFPVGLLIAMHNSK